ncbi:MAG: (Fe-S)-binding protein [Betaproteobacteria bacterium]|jgi:L-lactate dehydrogenase complex protein LldE|nr:(Fe-S)-binding protein [Betaproteobacteria bacterium]
MTENPKRIALFVTCLVDMMRPEIGLAALKLLEASGCEVIVPEGQTCCGQPAYNGGDRRTAHQLAVRVIEQLQGFDYVVIPSGSCAGMIKVHYFELFGNDPEMKRRMADLAPRIYELTDFLVRVMKVSDVPGQLEGTVTYHDSCSGLRELGVAEQPRALLAKIPGLKLSEMKDCRACCGFGGAFAMKYGNVSAAIVDEKIHNVQATQAQAVVMGDLGCMLHIEGRLRRLGDERTQVLHVAQVLAGDVGQGRASG